MGKFKKLFDPRHNKRPFFMIGMNEILQPEKTFGEFKIIEHHIWVRSEKGRGLFADYESTHALQKISGAAQNEFGNFYCSKSSKIFVNCKTEELRLYLSLYDSKKRNLCFIDDGKEINVKLKKGHLMYILDLKSPDCMKKFTDILSELFYILDTDIDQAEINNHSGLIKEMAEFNKKKKPPVKRKYIYSRNDFKPIKSSSYGYLFSFESDYFEGPYVAAEILSVLKQLNFSGICEYYSGRSYFNGNYIVGIGIKNKSGRASKMLENFVKAARYIPGLDPDCSEYAELRGIRAVTERDGKALFNKGLIIKCEMSDKKSSFRDIAWDILSQQL